MANQDQYHATQGTCFCARLIDMLWDAAVILNIEGIFELFRRAHRQDEFEGAGIGLTIARKIVEYHGGRIWVESTPGEHTVFYFSIAKQVDNHSQGA